MGATTGPAGDPTRLGRRTLLRAGLLAGAAAPLLSACRTRTRTYGKVIIPTPDNPVEWPLSKRYARIESGLKPKSGSVLRIYNYSDYLSPKMMKEFEAKWGVDIHLSTFNDEEEALTKIAAESLGFDLYFPSYDSVGKLVQAELVRPLNPDYLTNFHNLWPSFHDPWYDRGSRYTVPYTIYSTGIGWRTDMVSADIAGMDNPYDVFWDTTYKSNLAILDDWHTAMAMVLLRNGIYDINTTDPKHLQMIRDQLNELRETMRPKVTISMYNDLAVGQYGLAQFWSGDIINAPYYMPKHTDPGILRYWFPPSGRGEIDNDLVVCLGQGSNPVAAHYFMNQILDVTSAGQNFGFTGYQPPLNRFTPDTLVKEGYVPENLSTAIVRPHDFDKGIPLLQVPVTAETEYLQIWQEFKSGG